MSNPIDDQSFNISFHFGQDWISCFDLCPGFKRQERFDRARGAGVKSYYSRIRRAAKEKSHADGNQQTVPLAVGETKIRQGKHSPRNTLVLRPHSAKEDGASIAGTKQFT